MDGGREEQCLTLVRARRGYMHATRGGGLGMTTMIDPSVYTVL
jgi:hypothetical protein